MLKVQRHICNFHVSAILRACRYGGLGLKKKEGGRGGVRERRVRGWQVSLPVYIANMLKSLKGRL